MQSEKLYKILIVEDEASLRLIYTEYLSQKGYYKILEAGDGKEAVKIALENPDLDLILLDIVLPIKDGLKTLQELKTIQKTKHIKILILSQMSSDQVIKQGFSLGAEGYLIKDTVNPEELEKEVFSIVSKA